MPFTNSPWNSPESDLTADEFCAVSLVDLNAPGEEKVKAKCKLPIKSTPGGPYNMNAMRAAAARMSQMTGVPAEEKRKAAKKLVRLMREADMEPGEHMMQMAGE